MTTAQTFGFEDIFPNMEYRMNRKTTTASRSVYHLFIRFRIEHFYAHINHITRGKVLPFFAFTAFIDKILKSFIYHIKVGIEQFHIL